MTNALIQSGLFGSLLQDADTASCFGAVRQLTHLRAFERAYTVALAETGQAAPDAAQEALTAIETREIDLQALAAGSDKDGLPVPAFVAALRDGLNPKAAEAIHSGATSQDVQDTAMMLTLHEVLDLFDRRLTGIIARLDALTDRFGATQMIGRTRMQAALPITVANRLNAWCAPLQSRYEDIAALRAQLTVQLGGPVGLRSMPEAPALLTILGRELNLPTDAPVWHSDRSRIIAFGHWLSLTAGALGKMGQDIALMAQQGVDEVALSNSGGSSAMPHKQNPVSAELLVTLARYVGGQQGVLAQALIHEQERSGQAWALEWLILPSMAEATGAALALGHDLLGKVDRLGPQPAG